MEILTNILKHEIEKKHNISIKRQGTMLLFSGIIILNPKNKQTKAWSAIRVSKIVTKVNIYNQLINKIKQQ